MRHILSENLQHKPRIVIGTKLDLPETKGRLDELRASLPDERVFGISVFSREGISDVRDEFLRFVLSAEKAEEARKAGGTGSENSEEGDSLDRGKSSGEGALWSATAGWKDEE